MLNRLGKTRSSYLSRLSIKSAVADHFLIDLKLEAMKVVLSHGYFLHEDEAEQKIMMPYPPQGILHIGTYLQIEKN